MDAPSIRVLSQSFVLIEVFNYVVNDVSYVESAMRGEVPGMERRRFWRDDDKLEGTSRNCT